MLYSIHLMGAEILKVPELELDRMEAKRISEAVQEVAKHYHVACDPKKVAIFQLGMVCAGVYGTRIFAIRNRLKSEQTAKPRPVPIDRAQGKQQTKTQAPENHPMSPSEIFGDMNGTL